MPPKAWAKVYGRKAIPTLRNLNYFVSVLGKNEVRKLKTGLIKPLLRDSVMSDEEREQVREMADAVVDGGEQLGKYEFTWLTFTMGNLLLQSEEENTEEDAERFRQLCVIYDDLQKRITKLKIKCPGCGRSLKGVTRAMIGDVGVCPKCKAEFIVEPKDEQSNK